MGNKYFTCPQLVFFLVNRALHRVHIVVQQPFPRRVRDGALYPFSGGSSGEGKGLGVRTSNFQILILLQIGRSRSALSHTIFNDWEYEGIKKPSFLSFSMISSYRWFLIEIRHRPRSFDGFILFVSFYFITRRTKFAYYDFY